MSFESPALANCCWRDRGIGCVRVDPHRPEDRLDLRLGTLIAAQLVFGVSSGQGSLGRFIFENRNLLDIPAVFVGLLTAIAIGLVVET